MSLIIYARWTVFNIYYAFRTNIKFYGNIKANISEFRNIKKMPNPIKKCQLHVISIPITKG